MDQFLSNAQRPPVAQVPQQHILPPRPVVPVVPPGPPRPPGPFQLVSPAPIVPPSPPQAAEKGKRREEAVPNPFAYLVSVNGSSLSKLAPTGAEVEASILGFISSFGCQKVTTITRKGSKELESFMYCEFNSEVEAETFVAQNTLAASYGLIAVKASCLPTRRIQLNHFRSFVVALSTKTSLSADIVSSPFTFQSIRNFFRQAHFPVLSVERVPSSSGICFFVEFEHPLQQPEVLAAFGKQVTVDFTSAGRTVSFDLKPVSSWITIKGINVSAVHLEEALRKIFEACGNLSSKQKDRGLSCDTSSSLCCATFKNQYDCFAAYTKLCALFATGSLTPFYCGLPVDISMAFIHINQPQASPAPAAASSSASASVHAPAPGSGIDLSEFFAPPNKETVPQVAQINAAPTPTPAPVVDNGKKEAVPLPPSPPKKPAQNAPVLSATPSAGSSSGPVYNPRALYLKIRKDFKGKKYSFTRETILDCFPPPPHMLRSEMTHIRILPQGIPLPEGGELLDTAWVYFSTPDAAYAALTHLNKNCNRWLMVTFAIERRARSSSPVRGKGKGKKQRARVLATSSQSDADLIKTLRAAPLADLVRRYQSSGQVLSAELAANKEQLIGAIIAQRKAKQAAAAAAAAVVPMPPPRTPAAEVAADDDSDAGSAAGDEPELQVECTVCFSVYDADLDLTNGKLACEHGLFCLETNTAPHFTCFDCVEQGLGVLIGDAATAVPSFNCPAIGCGHMISNRQIITQLPNRAVASTFNSVCTKVLLRSERQLECCGLSVSFSEFDANREPQYECYVCGKMYCLLCDPVTCVAASVEEYFNQVLEHGHEHVSSVPQRPLYDKLASALSLVDFPRCRLCEDIEEELRPLLEKNPLECNVVRCQTCTQNLCWCCFQKLPYQGAIAHDSFIPAHHHNPEKMCPLFEPPDRTPEKREAIAQILHVAGISNLDTLDVTSKSILASVPFTAAHLSRK